MKIEFEFQYSKLFSEDLILYYHVNSQTSRRAVCTTVFFGEFFYEGWSICSPKDNFRKSRGRKLAVADAIKNLCKEDRKKIWKAYFDMCKG